MKVSGASSIATFGCGTMERGDCFRGRAMGLSSQTGTSEQTSPVADPRCLREVIHRGQATSPPQRAPRA